MLWRCGISGPRSEPARALPTRGSTARGGTARTGRGRGWRKAHSLAWRLQEQTMSQDMWAPEAPEGARKRLPPGSPRRSRPCRPCDSGPGGPQGTLVGDRSVRLFICAVFGHKSLLAVAANTENITATFPRNVTEARPQAWKSLWGPAGRLSPGQGQSRVPGQPGAFYRTLRSLPPRQNTRFPLRVGRGPPSPPRRKRRCPPVTHQRKAAQSDH